MNRKLLLLDVVLLAVVVYAGMQFRTMYREAKARQAAQRSVKVQPVAPPPIQPAPPAPPVLATTYAKIAQNLLLDKSRNPEVPVEVPPPPPPPPPMPPLPLYHGMMDFGDSEGKIAIMSLAQGKPHKTVHAGETIGEFTLLAVSRDGIDLQWRDQKVHKRAEEILDRSHTQAPAPEPAKIAGGYATPPPPRPDPPAPAQYGPGADAGTVKRCVDNDTTPAGAVVGGFRKIDKPGPFGRTCYWEPIGGR
ncbi:MAG TPA: hypothetical protein VG456_20320 [Candidatus Sulfopaludibacter sp.]|nr:hypothetical protein [Candidatus Sulfopaludibacter sp.]